MPTNQKGHTQPWVEKYRPKSIAELSSQDQVVQVLQSTIKSKNLPHLLFYGPPGTGKTSTALALAHQLFSPSEFKNRVLELNASDERGIDVVRDKIKTFARLAIPSTTGNAAGKNGAPPPPYKLIILDEADSMTADAQSALRRTMETYSKVTRFCLICNYVSRIIEPLASRCAKFRFRQLDKASALARLQHICRNEGLAGIGDRVLTAIIDISNGDLRRAITYLQTSSRLLTSATGGSEHEDVETICDIAGVVPTETLESLLKVIQAGSLDDVKETVSTILRAGYSCQQVIVQLNQLVVAEPSLSARFKCHFGLEVGQMEKCLKDGANPHLQLLNLAFTLHGVETN